jgi:type I restriction enzyme, S subunit
LATSDRFREFAIIHMAGTTGRQRLAAADLQDYPVAKPDDAKLDAFGTVAATLLQRVKAAVDESRVLAATRDELLPLLMSGRVTIREAERTVSEAT